LIASPSAGDWLRRTLKTEHALVPRLDGEPVGVLAGLGGPLRRRADRRAIDALSRLRAHSPNIKAQDGAARQIA